jgi:archaellum component FlaF (FlaF/FlaG flagellin family)
MIVTMVLMGCLLMAIPAMATTVGAQTAEDTTFTSDATLDNETVTVSVTSNDTAVENATVAVNGTEAGTTDATGTLQFGLDNRSTVEIGVTVDNTTQTTTYEVVDGSLVEQTENTDDSTEFAFDATLDNETVTVAVTSNETAVENATVAVNGTEAGSTDATGTLQFGLENRSAVEIAVTVDGTTRTTTYDVVEGELVEQEATEESTEFASDVTLDNGTVTVSVTSNGTTVENAAVAVNGTEVGPTDANGTLQFPLENRPAVEIAVTVDETTQTTTYVVVGGELITQQSAADAQEVPEEAADQVSTIQKLISAFRNGEFEKLGPIVSEAAGRGPPADAGSGSGNAPEDAGNGQGNAPENAGNGQGNAPENAGNGQGNAPENASNGQGNAPEDAGNGQGNAPENAGNGQGNGGNSGQGNGGSGGNGNSGGNSGQGNGQGGGPPASITLSR